MNLIDRMNEESGQSFIVITHYKQVAKTTNRIIQMKDGVFKPFPNFSRTKQVKPNFSKQMNKSEPF
jgi:ABC-type lipoprotein export system ATPase subunit